MCDLESYPWRLFRRFSERFSSWTKNSLVGRRIVLLGRRLLRTSAGLQADDTTKVKLMQTSLRTLVVAAVLAVGGPALSFAIATPNDETSDWNRMVFWVGLVGGTSPLVITRVAAIVQAAVFDSVSGIDRRYTPIHVLPAAPAGASKNAAVAQAACATLLALSLDARLAVSLTSIGARESKDAIARGTAWGQSVADAILSWRSTDAFTPPPTPFLGGNGVGTWRPLLRSHRASASISGRPPTTARISVYRPRDMFLPTACNQ